MQGARSHQAGRVSILTYEVLNSPAFSKKSRHGKFIYVLIFNVAGQRNVPYYVGQSSGLTARFSSHQMIMWHFAKFEAPAHIWIAGEVPAAKADAAEQDLIHRLSDAGYRLTNSTISHSRAKRIQKQEGLLGLTTDQIRVYLSRNFSRTRVLSEWTQKWIPAPPGYVAAGATLTTSQVIEYVSALEYPSSLVRNVSVAIAEHHDPKIGYSRIVFKEAMRGVPGVSKVYNHARKLTGLWFFNRAILPDHLHDFRLTARHLAAVRIHTQNEAPEKDGLAKARGPALPPQ
jgi:hypothetical protein